MFSTKESDRLVQCIIGFRVVAGRNPLAGARINGKFGRAANLANDSTNSGFPQRHFVVGIATQHKEWWQVFGTGTQPFAGRHKPIENHNRINPSIPRAPHGNRATKRKSEQSQLADASGRRRFASVVFKIV